MRISTITTTTNSDYAAKSIKAVSQTSQQHAQTASGVITPRVLQALEAWPLAWNSTLYVS
jgi:hypothetical protein